MRLRFVVLASLLTACVAVAAPALSDAAPQHNDGLTIAATPNPVPAGGGVLIYGQLSGSNISGQQIRLYHRINPASHYTLVSTTNTNSFGFYEFTRAEGVVLTNRSWYVRGPNSTHSRTVHERVSALVSLAASTTTGQTNHPVLFTGHVTPRHAFERVFLQEQDGLTGDDWTTLKSGLLGPGSNYSIAYTWHRPGVRDVRVVFAGDDRNIRGESDPLTVAIQQTQVAGFTITASPGDVIPEGSPVTISGVLDKPGTSTPEGSTSVTLWAHGDGQNYHAITSALTDPNGNYSFSQIPLHNEVYKVRTTLPDTNNNKFRSTAQLFEGVRDVVTITPSSMSSTVGGTVTFLGNVSPDKAGHVIYLQRKGSDGDWHNVETGSVNGNSNYRFSWTFGMFGPHSFRVRIPGGPENVGGASAPVTIMVSGVAPVTTLPPGS